MHPALSIVCFTTLSGTGFGLWCWLGLRIATARMLTPFEPIGWAIGLILGAGLVVAGVIASLRHLGRPLRVWRAFSQWRSSWMSREGVLSLAAFAAALATFTGLMFPEHAPASRVAAALLAVLSLAAVCCTAMIYASLPPIPAWRHRLVVPGYLGFALVGGLFPFRLCVLMPAGWSHVFAALLVLGPLALAVLKHRYWRDLDRTPLPFTRGDAVGLFTAGERATLELAPGRHAWVHVARGAARVGDHELRDGDGLAVSEEPAVLIEGLAGGEGEVLVFDLG